MTAEFPVPFECVDGLFYVPRRFTEALAEVRAEGGLTVELAHRLVARWRVESGNPGLLDGRRR
jgi:hypothetical protein